MTKKLMKRDLFDALWRSAEQSDCFLRKYAAAVVKDHRVLGLGHSLIPNGDKCAETGICPRRVLQDKYGETLEFFEACPLIHAEMAAILACRRAERCKGASLYLLGINQTDHSIHKDAFPCAMCLRHIVHLGIQTVCVVQSGRLYHAFSFVGGRFQ